MSATIHSINERCHSPEERLMAASSEIIKLEAVVKAADKLIDFRQSQVEALVAVSDAAISLLDVSRALFPTSFQAQLEALIAKSRHILAMVDQ